MKKSNYLPLIVFATILFFASCAPQKKYLTTDPTLPVNKEIKDVKNEKERVNLIGISNRVGLQQAPFNEWYQKYYAEYKPNPKVISKGKSKMKGVEVLAFLGTWCGDSKRGVPQFYKVMDEMGFDEKNLKLVSVSDSKEQYKRSPNGEEKGLNIFRVPTFIFYKEGKEIGRIVETPTTSFEVDVAQIVNGLAPTPNFKTQALIHGNLEAGGFEKIEESIKNYGRYVSRRATGPSELNAYGYVLLRSGKIKEAILIFRINALAYPHYSNVFDSLAEAYLVTGNEKLAIENYKKVLELKPEDEHARKELKKLGITNFTTNN
ncbi:MAG: thioredoxin family protein [Saprospiraceae bacterium]